MYNLISYVQSIISENIVTSIFSLIFVGVQFFLFYYNQNATNSKKEQLANSINYAGLIFLRESNDDQKDPVLKIELTELFKLCAIDKDFEKIRQLLIHPLSFVFLSYTQNDNEYYIYWTINEKKKINYPLYHDGSINDLMCDFMFNEAFLKKKSLNPNKVDVSNCLEKYSGPRFDYYKSLNLGLNCRFLWDYDSDKFIFNKNTDILELEDIMSKKKIICKIDDKLVSKINE